MIQALIVDDECLVRMGLRLVFPWEKYHIEIVGEAASGEKALAFLQTQPVQLVVTDITMPGMSGLDLLRNVRAFDPSIKVVMLTCHQDFDYIQESLRLGAIDYIVKTQLENQDLDEILQRIVKHIEPEQPKLFESKNPVMERKLIDHLKCSVWVVDDRKFEEMLQMAKQMTAESDWKKLLAEGVEQWKQYYPKFPAWSAYTDLPKTTNEIVEWLKKLRIELQKWLRKSAYSEDIIYAIVKSLELIRESFVQHISQTELCKKVNISKSYFSTSFKEILGISFIHYLQWINIGRAREMILNTNHPIYWIAEQCGFMDQRYFSKLFKEQTGLLPSELRQQQQGRE